MEVFLIYITILHLNVNFWCAYVEFINDSGNSRCELSLNPKEGFV